MGEKRGFGQAVRKYGGTTEQEKGVVTPAARCGVTAGEVGSITHSEINFIKVGPRYKSFPIPEQGHLWISSRTEGNKNDSLNEGR